MSTYVVSDIHGLKDRYDAMMKDLCLKEDDVLYVLGDVIDRGPYGISILRDIMKRKQVTMLLGNHEYMMKQYYEAKEGLFEDPNEAYVIQDRWYRNHCESTMKEFESLSKEEQKEILLYLGSLPLAVCDLMVNGKTYYLTHGCASEEFLEGTIYEKDLDGCSVTVEHFVWNRMDIQTSMLEDRCIVVGHTPTLFFQNNTPYEIFYNTDDIKDAHVIDIDCGCAANNSNTQLGVLCLDDLTVRYY